MADPGSSAADYLKSIGGNPAILYTQPMQGGSASATASAPTSSLLQGAPTQPIQGGGAASVVTPSGLQVNPQTGTAFDPNTQSTYDSSGNKISGNGPSTNAEASAVIRDVVTNTNRNIVNNNNEVTNQNQVLNRVAISSDTGQTDITGTATNQTTGTRNLTSNQTGTTNLTGSARTYLDIPTPEQFLDDFQNAFATHISGLGLGAPEQQWVMDNMGMFLNEYIGELGTMAARGEPVFKPTDIKDDAYYLGSRAGEVSSTRQQGTTNTQTLQQDNLLTNAASRTLQTGVGTTVGSQQTTGQTQTDTQQTNQQAISEAIQSAINASQTGVDAYGNPTGGTSSQTTNEQNTGTTNTRSNQAGLVNENNVLNTNNTQFSNQTTNRNVQTRDLSNIMQNEVANRDLTQNTNMTEDIYGRSAVGYVHTLAPLDFLGQKFGEGTLNVLFQGQKGARQAAGRSSGGYSGRLIG